MCIGVDDKDAACGVFISVDKRAFESVELDIQMFLFNFSLFISKRSDKTNKTSTKLA